MWWITVDEALQHIAAGVRPLPLAPEALDSALGHVLAQDTYAPHDLPPFANSAMDGYALIASDTAAATESDPVTLCVTDAIAAGQFSKRHVERGHAARIMTGAPIPTGADAVIKFEDVAATTATAITIPCAITAGTHIRLPGEDIEQGQIALRAGTRLTPAAIGLLAALGIDSIPCYRQPRVAIIGTGDELVPPGQPLAPGKIHNSNDYLLAALARQAGAEVTRYPATSDQPAVIQARLAEAVAGGADLIVTSGGVSVGDFDFVKDALQSAGDITFWQVRMRPGKPLAFGHVAGVPLLGLPGNPVAAFVGFTLFGRAILRRMQGLDPLPTLRDAICVEPVRNGSGRRNFLRGIATLHGAQLEVRLASGQLPTQLMPLATSNCLIVAHEDVALYPTGATVPVMLLDAGLEDRME